MALFIVSLSASAQTDNVAKTDKDTDTSAIVAVNVERLAPSFEVKNEDNQKTSPKFSAAKFMQAVQDSVTMPETPVVTITSSSAFQLVPAPTTKSNTVKGVTFVPSRGPKFPWQVF